MQISLEVDTDPVCSGRRHNDTNQKQNTTMQTYTLTYADRYYPAQCNGSFKFEASSQEEARKIAIQWLQDNGGIEGISFSVR